MAPKSNRIRILLLILGVATAAAVARELPAKEDAPQMPAKDHAPEMPAKDDAPEVPTEGEDHMTVADPKTGKFEPIPDMPACATGAVVRGNPRSGPAWVYLKLASGCQVPWHWHTPNEELVVISGEGTLETKDGASIPIAPGVFAAMPSKHVHRANCSRSCLLFSMSDDAFDIHYVNATGEEIELEEAVKAAVPTPKAKVQKKSSPKKK